LEKGEIPLGLNLPIAHNEKIECPKCKKSSNINFEINDIEYASSDERGMGTETEYSFTIEVKCPNCENLFEVDGVVWEYPVGAVNLIQLV
jgi:phage FluMu protein Com